ncbi:hypothetical protein [Photobacterium alginatilyticum]|uniref:Uncharacterized protein n=1 Tax=Photobacterium alginatilyticum TaxID=1775171 RepID=A0ABW9YLF2_9GAMM|nr:hypothetical protein [Photobacterium alginatilyticum]NBI54682.1 hypothetical protein [Photobacterium alginatilyticum]
MRHPVNNSIEAFIVKNIDKKLQEEGYPPEEIDRGINEALRFYRNTASFAKGKVFDSCLTKARHLIKPNKKAASRSKKSKKAAA